MECILSEKPYETYIPLRRGFLYVMEALNLLIKSGIRILVDGTHEHLPIKRPNLFNIHRNNKCIDVSRSSYFCCAYITKYAVVLVRVLLHFSFSFPFSLGTV